MIYPLFFYTNSYENHDYFSHTFHAVINGLPEFIKENDADWKMVTDYVLTKVALTVSEWNVVGNIYDDVINSK